MENDSLIKSRVLTRRFLQDVEILQAGGDKSPRWLFDGASVRAETARLVLNYNYSNRISTFKTFMRCL